MKSKLDRIMDIFTRLVCGQEFLGPNEIRPLVAAILAEPDVIVVDGVKWMPQRPAEYQHLSGDDLWTVDGESCLWSVRKNAELVCAFSDLPSALAAASAAIKGEK
jgi:hypothetical protein